MSQNLLKYLLCKGDRVYVQHGRLFIEPASGKAVPENWLRSKQNQLITEAIMAMNIRAYTFCKHTTGRYQKVAGGLTLHFSDLANKGDAFCIFNVELSRARTTKHGTKGSPLPNGQFRPGKRSEFIRFWDRTGLPYPRDFSSFYERMGKLKQLVFTGSYCDKEKLDKHSITPLSISYGCLITALNTQNHPGKTSGIFRESIGNPSGRSFGNDLEQTQTIHGLQTSQSTGLQNYGNKVIRGEVIRNTSLRAIESKPPAEQTVDEWLHDRFENT